MILRSSICSHLSMIVIPVSLFYDYEHGLIIRQLSVWPHHSAAVSLVLLFAYRQPGLIVLTRMKTSVQVGMNLSAENERSEQTKPSAKGNDGRPRSRRPVIPHSNCSTSLLFPPFRVCCAVSVASNDSKMKDQPTMIKLTIESPNSPQLTVQAPHFICRDPVPRHVCPV
jgi:hypothetical protein